MSMSRRQLGALVQALRERANLSQDDVARDCGVKTNRSAVAHLEQGLRLPEAAVLKAICDYVGVPELYWRPFANDTSLHRLRFEEALSELVGFEVTLESNSVTQEAAERQIDALVGQTPSPKQAYDLLTSVLVFYGVPPVSRQFFEQYFSPQTFASLATFEQAVKLYQLDAIRLFSTLGEAYRRMNVADDLQTILAPLRARDLSEYHDRAAWELIRLLPDERLPDLGYISAARIRKESTERRVLQEFLTELADKIDQFGHVALEEYTKKRRRKMDSLLRKFDEFPHGLFSPLFVPDADEVRRKAERLAPKSEDELGRIEQTQQTALGNLANYLTADHMDVYVATSMRSDADFVSVNHFVQALFSDDRIRPLKLRYFNPTQSWIDDRIAKGLVEALMLRRCSVTIYMAQKEDTFGKDSEASVALGQGKPVIVYVPKLLVGGRDVDSEALFKETRARLEELVIADPGLDQAEFDESDDDVALVASLMEARLGRVSDDDLRDAVQRHWADFDLHGEAERVPEEHRATYRSWLDATARGEQPELLQTLRPFVIQILVSHAVRFEKRAKVFKEIHPLALQVILSSGVLNGIIVVRSVDQCAAVLEAVVANRLSVELRKDELNYRLVETSTDSTVRVISRNKLLQNAFEAVASRAGEA